MAQKVCVAKFLIQRSDHPLVAHNRAKIPETDEIIKSEYYYTNVPRGSLKVKLIKTFTLTMTGLYIKITS